MDPFWVYFGVFITVPWLLAVILGFAAVSVGCHFITPNKVVRIIFPYIRRNGNNTVMFGFILTEHHIIALFFAMSWIMYVMIWVFLTNILIIYTNNNNLFSATSIELQCLYDNDTIVNLTAIERLELDEDITCYAINLNIAGAMGQATGTLAFGWIITSIASWIILNANNWIKQRITKMKNCKINFKYYKILLFILGTIIGVAYVAGIYIILGLNIKWLYFYVFRPENALIITILGALPFILDINIKKETKSLEECCRETMKTKQKNTQKDHEKMKRLILREMAEHECKRQIAYETAVDINDEEEIKNIVSTVYDNIMKCNEDREEEELRTINGSIEDNDNDSSSNGAKGMKTAQVKKETSV